MIAAGREDYKKLPGSMFVNFCAGITILVVVQLAEPVFGANIIAPQVVFLLSVLTILIVSLLRLHVYAHSKQQSVKSLTVEAYRVLRQQSLRNDAVKAAYMLGIVPGGIFGTMLSMDTNNIYCSIIAFAIGSMAGTVTALLFASAYGSRVRVTTKKTQ